MKPHLFFSRISLLTFFFFCPPLVHSQILIGPKAGINFSSWHGTGSEGSRQKNGLHIGAVFQIPINDELAFVPELEYSMEGVNTEDVGGLRVNLNYVNIPLLVRGLSSKFYYEGGILFGYLLNAQGKIGGVSADINELFKKGDFAFVGGFGYRSPKGLGFGARYNFGFANVSSDKESVVANGVYQLSMFYLFNPKRKNK